MNPRMGVRAVEAAEVELGLAELLEQLLLPVAAPVPPSVGRRTWKNNFLLSFQPRAKGDEATHSLRIWETKGSRKLLAPLKRTSVMLSSVRVSRETGITRAIQGNVVVWSGGECGQPEGGVSKTPANTPLEPLYYTVVQQYTT